MIPCSTVNEMCPACPHGHECLTLRVNKENRKRDFKEKIKKKRQERQVGK